MKILLIRILILAIFLSGCLNTNNIPISTETTTPQLTRSIATETMVATATVSEISTATETPSPTRVAKIIDIQNNVVARTSYAENFVSAGIGMQILPSGGIETQSDGRARIDLLPEGTIIRLEANTSFAFGDIALRNDQAETTIDLLYGKAFILLNGGSLTVRTGMGIASVGQGLMRVLYEPSKNLLRVSCLDGDCMLMDQTNDRVELGGGEFSSITDNQAPTAPTGLFREEINEWRDEIPELPYFMVDLPDPNKYPAEHPAPVITPARTRHPHPTTYP